MCSAISAKSFVVKALDIFWPACAHACASIDLLCILCGFCHRFVFFSSQHACIHTLGWPLAKQTNEHKINNKQTTERKLNEKTTTTTTNTVRSIHSRRLTIKNFDLFFIWAYSFSASHSTHWMNGNSNNSNSRTQLIQKRGAANTKAQPYLLVIGHIFDMYLFAKLNEYTIALWLIQPILTYLTYSKMQIVRQRFRCGIAFHIHFYYVNGGRYPLCRLIDCNQWKCISDRANLITHKHNWNALIVSGFVGGRGASFACTTIVLKPILIQICNFCSQYRRIFQIFQYVSFHLFWPTGVCTNATAPSVSSINRILRNRAAERAAAEFARAAGYGLYPPNPYSSFAWPATAHLWSAGSGFPGISPGSATTSGTACSPGSGSHDTLGSPDGSRLIGEFHNPFFE